MKLTDRPILKGRFVARPNRFLVRCEIATFGVIDAFLPNPGRLQELLLPGVELWVTDSQGHTTLPRKTRFTVVAVARDKHPICLDTHATNRVARFLVETGQIPDLATARVVRGEVAVGRHRFDWLLEQGGAPLYLEVKSVTLHGNRVAMFPDAVTERGRRHLLELKRLAEEGTRTAVLFVVHAPDVDWFIPDYHTDLAFAQAFLEVQRQVQLLAVAVRWQKDLALAAETKMLEIPWPLIEREVRDRGAYLLILRLLEPKRAVVGELGVVDFKPGYYVYVGSAMNGLTQRIARHLRRRKQMHWHMDYLRQVADEVSALPVRSSRRLEHDLADALSKILEPGPKGFGATDSPHATHLFFSQEDPLERRDLHVLLQRFRMPSPAPN